MKKCVAYSLCVIFFFSVSFTALQASEPEEIGEKFVSELLSGDSDKAVKLYMEPTVQNMLGLKLNATLVQMDSYSKAFGGYQTKEVLHREYLSSYLLRMVYILHTPVIPVAFEVFIYKTKKGWKVTSFSFDTDMDVIFPATVSK